MRLDRRALIAGTAGLAAGAGLARADTGSTAPAPTRLPESVAPQIGCWFWGEAEFAPDGWRKYLDLVAAHSPYRLLTTSIRAPLVEVTQEATREQITQAAADARRRGMGVVMDLDVRLAREAFRAAYPDEMQEALRLRVWPVAAETVECRIESLELNDHYTGRTTPYIALAGRAERVYAFRLEGAAVAVGSVLDITDRCTGVETSEKAVAVRVTPDALEGRTHVALLAVFTHLSPDVFAPHLLAFQRGILVSYREARLAGACKDEWGFPPCFDGNPEHNDFWYSRPMAAEYASRTDGRELVRDFLLMHLPEAGRESERAEAVNVFQRMCWERNVLIECDFYEAVKEAFGPDAVVATHPTWWPFPGPMEIKKNGLSWWGARRDLAQTDEGTPYCCRTALAKKWGSPAWWNMYYAPQLAEYEREVWASALAGGRINYHPPWPVETPIDQSALLHEPLLRAECRVRLLNLITDAPLDCPVAVVFGHWTAMNWCGASFADTGVAVAERFWIEGYPADLIPSSELLSGSLHVDREGWVCYGAHRYSALVVYHPEYEGSELTRLVRRSVEGPTTVCTIEAGTDPEETVRALAAHLSDLGIVRQSPAVHERPWGFEIAEPAPDGNSRLTDGTRIFACAVANTAGDAFDLETEVDGHPVHASATGLLAVRLAAGGRLEGLAAGGLTHFRGGGVSIRLAEPLDLALRHDDSGGFTGWIQGWDGPVPKQLLDLTRTWRRLALPDPVV